MVDYNDNTGSNTSTVCCEFNVTRTEAFDQKLAFGVFLPTACLIGAFGNLVYFWVLSDRRQLPAPTYVYLTVLAIAQFSALLAQAALLASQEQLISYPINEYLHSYLIWPIYNYSSVLSYCLTTVVTIELYCYVREASTPITKFRLLKGQRRARLVCFATCLLVGIFNFPRMIVYKFDESSGCAVERWRGEEWFPLYTLARTFVYNIGCTILLVIFQILLIVSLKKRFRFRYNLSSAVSLCPITTVAATRRRRKVRLTVALIASGLFSLTVELYVFVVNPVSISTFWRRFFPTLIIAHGSEFRRVTGNVALALLTAEHSMNFVFSLVFNNTLRMLLISKVTSTFHKFRELIFRGR